MIFLAIYIIGYFASLWAMHTFKRQLDIDDYEQDDYVDGAAEALDGYE